MFTPPNVSQVTCHMSRVTCHVSHVTFCLIIIFFKFFFIYLFIYLFFFWTKWWSLSVEGLSSTGLPRLVFVHRHFLYIVRITRYSGCLWFTLSHHSISLLITVYLCSIQDIPAVCGLSLQQVLDYSIKYVCWSYDIPTGHKIPLELG